VNATSVRSGSVWFTISRLLDHSVGKTLVEVLVRNAVQDLLSVWPSSDGR